MRNKKLWLAGTLAVLAAIQFIQPARNNSGQVFSSDIAQQYAMPDEVKHILQQACYDCHSNYTRYPWYARVQPGAWWLARHIADGKAELNFHEFGDYSARRRAAKLKAIAGALKDGTMPLTSYKILHPEARLTAAQTQAILRWLENITP